jgi:prevent-host-death family protein
MKVNIHQAKTHFSELISKAIRGEEIIISKSGKPIAQLIPLGNASASRSPGSAKGKVVIRKNFMDPLPDEILDGFGS